ncbi:MAG: hypothetical protein HDT28_02295 [Clostridiales bacterium]|nr:hypothetical protein [Clostridiales bacterium]
MKKLIAMLALSAVTATSLAACGKPTPKAVDIESPAPSQTTRSVQQAEESGDGNMTEIEIKIDGTDLHEFFGKRMLRSPIYGVRRHFEPDIFGTYTVEYVHTPFGEEQDDTLSYELVLNSDNTFTLVATANGVTSDHYGHWYSSRRNITLFYDEPIDPTAHNVYVADALYAERLDQGKLLVYDNCKTIILSRQTADLPEVQAAR